MTVTELRKALRGVPGKAEVIMSSDAEGNIFRMADTYSLMVYMDEDIVHSTQHPKEAKMILLFPQHGSYDG